MVADIINGPWIRVDQEISKFKAAQKESNVKTVKTPAEFSAAVRSSKLTVVNFYKPSFNPCKYFNPYFEKMAAELGEYATFLNVSQKFKNAYFRKRSKKKSCKNHPIRFLALWSVNLDSQDDPIAIYVHELETFVRL